MGPETVSPPGLGFRLILPAFFVLFIVVNGPLSAWMFRRRYGFDPMSLSRPDPVMEFGERFRDGLFVVILVVSFAYAIWPDVQVHLGPIALLERPLVRWLAVVSLVVAMTLVRVGQIQLRGSWRFGVDRAHPPDEVVDAGLYAYSRNPIFVGMLCAALGLFLFLPNAVTFAVLVVAYVILAIRARSEEAFMEEVFGDSYRAYRARTPRWLLGPRG